MAEKAGVSVGSLYQYFPNKAAILFRLQSDEWRRTADLLSAILEDARRSPAKRLRALVHAFIRSECDEAAMRVALNDAAPLYRDAPEAREARASGDRTMRVFMREALPGGAESTLITTTLSKVGKHFSERPRSPTEIEACADAMADMLCAYVESLARVGASGSRHGILILEALEDGLKVSEAPAIASEAKQSRGHRAYGPWIATSLRSSR